MKKRLVLLCFWIAMFIGSGHSQPIKEYGALRVAGTQLADAQGRPVVLRGMSFGWHNFHPRFYNEKAVAWLASDWNCSVVRAAMGIEPKGGYKQNRDSAIQRVRAVVDGAIRAGIYVIVDWHSHNINLEEAKAFFAQMAADYSRYPNVIWEVFNEPDYESWGEVKAYATAVIEVIRARDPDNVILVGSPHWDQDIHLVADAPLAGFTNIMYTVHFYAATHKQELRDRCDYALSKGMPIFLSECAGMEATGDGPINEAEWMRWIGWAEGHRLSWVTWSVSDKNETCSVLYPSAASEGGWKEGDLKESGVKTRALLKTHSKAVQVP